MTIERAVRILAGSMILVSLALTYLFGPWGLALAAVVGVNLIQSAFTGVCPAESIFARLGLPAGGGCAPAAQAPNR